MTEWHCSSVLVIVMPTMWVECLYLSIVICLCSFVYQTTVLMLCSMLIELCFSVIPSVNDNNGILQSPLICKYVCVQVNVLPYQYDYVDMIISL